MRMYKRMPSSKVFAGKRYDRVGSYGTRREAEVAARRMRKAGNLARVTKFTDSFKRSYYMLFVRYQ